MKGLTNDNDFFFFFSNLKYYLQKDYGTLVNRTLFGLYSL